MITGFSGSIVCDFKYFNNLNNFITLLFAEIMTYKKYPMYDDSVTLC